MKTNKRRKEILFWTLQLVGWYAISCMVLILPELSETYKVYSLIGGGAVGIMVTSIYRVYLKNNIDTEVFGRQSIVRLLVAFMACTMLFFSFDALSEKLYEINWSRTPAELKWIKVNGGFFIKILDIMITIFGWTLIYFVIKFILAANENNLRNLELNATLREAQLNTLKGQVNPHFMFNSLNNIRGLMLEDVEKSRDMINKLSEMLEYALENNTIDAIPLEEELEMVENYIALSKIQMEDRLHYVEEIAPETLQISIPPMIIQLLVENAAKHGIANLKDGGTISVKTKKEDQNLYITVTNTGKLRIAKDSTQLGLKNIRQRLRLLHGQKASFSLEEKEGAVIANIKIPLS
ncbi:MAG: histidine kinase [Maribacter sp.]